MTSRLLVARGLHRHQRRLSRLRLRLSGDVDLEPADVNHAIQVGVEADENSLPSVRIERSRVCRYTIEEVSPARGEEAEGGRAFALNPQRVIQHCISEGVIPREQTVNFQFELL